MAAVPADRVGILLIRAWIEVGSASPLRAQLRWTTDVSRGLQKSITLIDVETVQSAVAEWLHEVLAAGEGQGEGEGDAVTPQ